MTDNQQKTKLGRSEPEEVSSLSEASRDDHSAKTRLLEAATKLFAENGLEGTSTRDIAKAADLNISLISYYFGGKEGLYKAVILEFANWAQTETDRFIEAVETTELNRESFKVLMHTFIGRMVPFKFHSREVQLILQREVMQGLPHAKEVYENIFSKITEMIVQLYQAGQDKGFVRRELNPYIIFLAMAHSTDIYFQVCHCQTQIQDKILKLPEQMELYIEQVYMLYVEGVLV